MTQIKTERVFGSPMARGSSAHLVHPGAVLCLVDLLPSIDVITLPEEGEEEEEEEDEEDEDEDEEEEDEEEEEEEEEEGEGREGKGEEKEEVVSILSVFLLLCFQALSLRTWQIIDYCTLLYLLSVTVHYCTY